jgi:hypothetical protein
MGVWFSSGRVVELVLALVVLEALALALWARKPLARWLPALGAGAGLLLGWRLALSGAPWVWVALALSAAGLAHGVDLWRLWTQR